jgi:hypothetical protein
MMNALRHWYDQDIKKQLAQLQLDTAMESEQPGHVNDLEHKKECALFGLDGILLPQNDRHSFLLRPWEHYLDDTFTGSAHFE